MTGWWRTGGGQFCRFRESSRLNCRLWAKTPPNVRFFLKTKMVLKTFGVGTHTHKRTRNALAQRKRQRDRETETEREIERQVSHTLVLSISSCSTSSSWKRRVWRHVDLLRTFHTLTFLPHTPPSYAHTCTQTAGRRVKCTCVSSSCASVHVRARSLSLSLSLSLARARALSLSLAPKICLCVFLPLVRLYFFTHTFVCVSILLPLVRRRVYI
jgi:hypothetical protein